MELQMPRVNHITISGRITKPIEIKNTATGKSVAQFSIAVDNPPVKKADGSWDTSAFFMDCVAWEHVATKLADKAGKGVPVLLQGRLSIRTADVQGQQRKFTEIIISDAQILGKAEPKPATPDDFLPPPSDEPF